MNLRNIKQFIRNRSLDEITKQKIRIHICYLLVIFSMVTYSYSYTAWSRFVEDVITPPANAQELKIETVDKVEKELSIKDYVKQEVEKAGLNWNEVECLVAHESGWDNWKYNINNNGTTDMGLWQINSIHKANVSVECRWDYKCSTKWAIEKRLHDGNWNAWYGYLNNCK
jgi:hypothetical protein